MVSIGFALQADPRDGASWVRLARQAEAAGFEAICVADHPGSTASPFVALAALAGLTSTIQLGTAVLNLGMWQPLSLAAEVATLHLLSEGRSFLGVGAGHTPSEWTVIGRPYPSPSERVARMIEVVDATRALLLGERVTARTSHVQLEEARLGWPAGPPLTVPLLVGGNGRGVLRYGARVAEMVELTGLGRTLSDGHLHVPRWDPAAVDQRIELITGERGGRDVRLGALVQRVVITPDRADVLVTFRDELVALLGEDLAPSMQALADTPFLLIGSDDEVVHQLRTNRDRWGITRYTVRAEAVEPLAPIIERLRSE